MRLLIPTLLAPLLLNGCQELSCNLMYAPSGVGLTFEATSWEEGEWLVEVGSQACTVILPASAGSVVCEDGDVARLEVSTTSAGDGIEGAWLMEEAPAELEVRFSLDGELVYEEILTPEYSVDEPNGEGCGERTYAEVDVDLG